MGVLATGGNAIALGHVQLALHMDGSNGMLMLSGMLVRLCCERRLLDAGEA